MKHRPWIIIAAAVCLQSSASAVDHPVFIHDGFMTGEEFLKGPSHDQMNYVTGAIDGMFLAPLFGAQKSELVWFEDCVVGKTNTQLVAIFVKFLNERPERWDQRAHTLFYSALRKACVK